MKRSLGTSLVATMLVLGCVAAVAQRDPRYNYDEKNVKPYTLPDPLVMNDGRPVTSANMWFKERRPELMRMFEENVYGRTPANAKIPLRYKVTEKDTPALGGKALRRQVTIYFTDKGEAGQKMHLLMYLPKDPPFRSAKGWGTHKIPVILGLSFQGTQTVVNDPGITLWEMWQRKPAIGEPGAGVQAKFVYEKPDEKTRGRQTQQWQVEKVVNRGYAIAIVYYGDIEPDYPEGIEHGVRPLFYANGQTKPAAEEWGQFGAWAWGLSRMLDYVLTDKRIDPKRVAVTGHSRLGKSADWAAAQDLRFTAVLSTESGKGGQSLYRRNFGETLTRIATVHGDWFCGNFQKWVNHDSEIPVDGNLLLAVLAPRPVYVASAEDDLWSDPRGEFLSAVDVSRVYEFLGKKGLGTKEMPAVNQPVGNTVAYHVRTGKHDVTEFDWDQYLNFLDREWARK